MTTKSYEALAQFYDSLMSEIDYELWNFFIHTKFRQYGVNRSILDLACGTGTVSTMLSQLGYNVTGVDRSEEMLAIAEEKARSAGSLINWLKQDMRHLRVKGPFDAVTCLCDGMSHLVEEADVQAVFKSVGQTVRPDGLFIFDVNTRWKLENVYGDNVYAEHSDGISYIWENTWDSKRNTCQMDLSFFVAVSDSLYERVDESVWERAYDTHDLANWLKEAGFQIKSVHCGYEDDEGLASLDGPDEGVERLVFVAQRLK